MLNYYDASSPYYISTITITTTDTCITPFNPTIIPLDSIQVILPYTTLVTANRSKLYRPIIYEGDPIRILSPEEIQNIIITDSWTHTFLKNPEELTEKERKKDIYNKLIKI